jgi:hypothetical protein
VDGPRIVKVKQELESLISDLEITIEYIEEKQTLYFWLNSRGNPRRYFNQECGETKLPSDPHKFMENTYKELTSLARGHPYPKEEIAARLERIGNHLWNKIIPEELKDEYSKFRSCTRSIVVNADNPWIPWEIIKPHDVKRKIDDPFWCCKFLFSRWLSGHGPESNLKLGIVLPVAPDKKILDHLKEEVEFMEQLNDLDPSIICQKHCRNYTDVMDWIENKNFSIMHFTSDCNPEDQSIKLNDYPLKPDDIHTMFGNAISDGGKRCRPLIFINTCNSGPTGVSLTLLGGWPSQFIQARAGAFIGTMWEIDDLLAVKFAKSFYTKLIRDKYNIAVAFRSARDDIREAMPHNSSWLAYVLYADPYAQMNY